MTEALFVTATGVTPEQFAAFTADGIVPAPRHPDFPLPGPDFSCFLITRACHEMYKFDERYIPCYCEDLSYHRELMLAGDGLRIFGTGFPFEHVGSGTINSMPPERRSLTQQRIEQGSRRHHAIKWGGGANAETFTLPFDPESARPGVTTGELFARVRMGQPALVDDVGIQPGTPDGAPNTPTSDFPARD